MTNNFIKSPDDVLLYAASLSLKTGYNSFKWHPVSQILYSKIIFMSFAVISFIDLATKAHPIFYAFGFMGSVWALSHWIRNTNLRNDLKKEWDINLYRQYIVEAEFLREATQSIRIVSLVSSVLGSAGIFYLLNTEYPNTSLWHAFGCASCFMSALSFIYLRSAVPPEPSSGSFSENRTVFQA